ncbi:MAG: hypothetical protein Q9165_003552 [Trypethelium subeluteriae]
MNYCVVAFGIVLIVATIQWFVDGRKNFSGPVSEEVLEATQSVEPGGRTANGHIIADEKDTEDGEVTK